MDEELKKSKTRAVDKQTDKNKEKRRSIKDIFGEYRGEYKRIIWPTREVLAKETVTVVIVCLIFAAIITVMDLAFLNGYSWLTSIPFGK